LHAAAVDGFIGAAPSVFLGAEAGGLQRIGLEAIAGKIPKRAALDGALGDDGALCEPC